MTDKQLNKRNERIVIILGMLLIWTLLIVLVNNDEINKLNNNVEVINERLE